MNRRRGYRGRTAERLSGRLAWFDGDCGRCIHPIISGQSQVVPGRDGGWRHVQCSSGARDGDDL